MNSPNPTGPGILSTIDLERLRPRLHRYCARMLGSTLDGEDVVQETMLRALEATPPQRPLDNPEGWLFRIAHNLALDLLRRRARAGTASTEDDVDDIADLVDELARREATAAALPTFMRMPASQRSVVILFDVLDYSAQEIGGILDLSVPAVKSLLQRGRGLLRELVDDSLQSPADHPPLPQAEQQLLRRYVELFNAHDFQTLRSLLAADVQLDLVNRLRLQGAAVGEYFTRYAQAPGWKAWPGQVEGRAAVLIQRSPREDARPDYFVLLEWTQGQVSKIRDFLFANYVSAAVRPTAMG